MGEKILLDTDIGSDIDDVLALTYLLNKPEAELLGITTVSGNADKRAQLAKTICGREGRKNISVYKGFSNPIINKQKQPNAPQAKVLEKNYKINKYPNKAIEFLKNTIDEYPNEVTLVTIGPLTNIAYLFNIYPQISKKIKKIVMMNGVFFTCPYETHKAEWNAYLDPIASKIVYNNIHNIDNLIVGLDVTTKCQIEVNECIDKFEIYQGASKTIIKALKVWKEEFNTVTFHDPLAIASIFKPKLINTERGVVEVELESKRLGGLTYWENNNKGSHCIVTEVKVKEFFKEYFSTLNI